jgi:hypothetical protein
VLAEPERGGFETAGACNQQLLTFRPVQLRDLHGPLQCSTRDVRGDRMLRIFHHQRVSDALVPLLFLGLSDDVRSVDGAVGSQITDEGGRNVDPPRGAAFCDRTGKPKPLVASPIRIDVWKFQHGESRLLRDPKSRPDHYVAIGSVTPRPPATEAFSRHPRAVEPADADVAPSAIVGKGKPLDAVPAAVVTVGRGAELVGSPRDRVPGVCRDGPSPGLGDRLARGRRCVPSRRTCSLPPLHGSTYCQTRAGRRDRVDANAGTRGGRCR